MLHRLHTAWNVLLLFTFPAIVFSQEPYRIAEPSPPADTVFHRNTLSILFDRNLNTYNWVGRMAIDTAAGGNRISTNAQYMSNIIVADPGAADTRRLRSDQVNLRLLLSRPVNPDLNVLTQWNSLVSTDNRGVGLSNASSHSLLAGIEFDPFPWLAASPMAGMRWDDQAGIQDRGLTVNLAGTAHDIDFEGYRMAGTAQFHRDVLDPRVLDSHFARMGIQKNFSGKTRDSLELGYSRIRREFYSLADSTIESRADNLIGFTNTLDYDVGGNVLTSIFVTVASRWLDKTLRPFGSAVPQQPLFETDINEFHLDAYIQTAYRSDDGNTSASVRLFRSERDETHALAPVDNQSASIQTLWADQNRQEKTKDNIARRTALSGTLDLPLSLSDRLAIAAWASILRYDTPSDLNVDDRDELLVAASIGTMHRISRYLEVGVSLDGTLSHLVYLLSERSANNNINRVLRLSPRVLCRPAAAVVSLNAFEVLANYTVYDFENVLAQVRSFSYRQIGWLDSTAVAVTDRIGLDFFVYFKLYERGQLNWDQFRERTQNSTVENTLALQVRFSPSLHSLFATGVRYFSQTRYAYGTEGKTLDSFISSFGPTCLIQQDLGLQSVLSFRGWLEHRKLPDGSSRTLGSMTLNILFSF